METYPDPHWSSEPTPRSRAQPPPRSRRAPRQRQPAAGAPRAAHHAGAARLHPLPLAHGAPRPRAACAPPRAPGARRGGALPRGAHRRPARRLHDAAHLGPRRELRPGPGRPVDPPRPAPSEFAGTGWSVPRVCGALNHASQSPGQWGVSAGCRWECTSECSGQARRLTLFLFLWGCTSECSGQARRLKIVFLFGWNKKQMLGALPAPSTPKCIPKGILVGNPPRPGL